MSVVKLEVLPDGRAILDGPFGLIEVDSFECDECGGQSPYTEMWEALTRRPSNGRLCAVLAFCGRCGPRAGATKHTANCDHD